MKQLVCEICGSTDLIKQDGVFVCQACGCKYSVEEVKKMMIEGTVDVSGSTVKIDSTAKLSNLRVLANRAKEDGDGESAAKYFEQIRIEDPYDWKAVFYPVYYSACSIESTQIKETVIRLLNTIETVFKVIKENVSEEEQGTSCSEISDKVFDLGQELISIYPEKSFSSRVTPWGEKQSYDLANNCYAPILVMYIVLGDKLIEVFNDYAEAKYAYRRAAEDLKPLFCPSTETIRNIRFLAANLFNQAVNYELEQENDRMSGSWDLFTAKTKEGSIPSDRLDETISIFGEIDKIIDSDKKRRVEEATKMVEKASSELIDNNPRSLDIKKIADSIADLEKQKNSLGLFKGNEKRELQTRIDILNAKKKNIQAEIDNEVASLSDVEAKCQKIRKMIDVDYLNKDDLDFAFEDDDLDLVSIEELMKKYSLDIKR